MAPVSNVAVIESDLPWAELAAIPETYATAWTCLFRRLKIQRGPDAVDSRRDGRRLGLAAVNMAVNAGVRVIATARSKERFAKLEALGVSRCEIEQPDLSYAHRRAQAGRRGTGSGSANSTVLDSLAMVRRDGKVCLAGWLGGLAPIADFNPLLQMPSGVDLTFFGSFVFGTPGFSRCGRAAAGDCRGHRGGTLFRQAFTRVSLR